MELLKNHSISSASDKGRNLQKKHHNYLLALRGFAALVIVFSHFNYSREVFLPLIGGSFIWLVYPDGQLFVWIFFILSGYLILKSFFTRRYEFTKAGLGSFYVRRIFKIVPVYYLIVLFDTFLLGLWKSADFKTVILKVITFRNEDQIVRYGYDYLWAIAIEMKWYLIAPIVFVCLYWFFGRIKYIGYILAVYIFFFGFFFRQQYFMHSFPWSWGNYMIGLLTPFYYNIDFLLFGGILNFILTSARKDNNHERSHVFIPQSIRILLACIGIGILYGVSSFVSYQTVNHYNEYIYFKGVIGPVLTMIFCGIFITVVEYQKYEASYQNSHIIPNLRQILTSPSYLLEWTGNLSFELYLVHLPIILLLRLPCPPELGSCTVGRVMQGMTVAYLFSITAAYLLHRGASWIYRLGKK